MAAAPGLAEAVEFAENPESRCPCVLLLDTSGSMQGNPITALSEGLQTFKDELMKDSLAARRVEVAVVSFNSEVAVVQDFVTADRFEPPTLTAGGLTCMGDGIQQALKLVRERKKQYRDNGVAYYRPWVFMITDGAPQGEPEETVLRAVQQIKEAEDNKGVAFFAVGVEGADMDRLAEIAVRPPLKLKGLNFTELFQWLSTSMSRVSQSTMGTQVALPQPGWAAV